MKKILLYSMVLISSIFFIGCGSGEYIQYTVSKDFQKAQEYVKDGKVNSENKDGNTALDFSVRSDLNLGITKYLLDNGADINHIGYNNYTPLLQSIDKSKNNSNIQTVKYLLEKGALLDSKTVGGWNALHLAAYNGETDIVRMLLERGMDINQKKDDGWTALHVSSRYGHTETVRFLIEKGAKLNEQNNYKWTPINLASYGNHLNIAKLLFINGASIKIRNNDGETPIDTASKKGYSSIVSYFRNAGQKERLERQRIAREKKENDLKIYIAKLIADGDFEVLKEYTDKNPNAVYYITNKSLRLALTGPKGMKVGDIRKLIKEGNSEVLVISLIKRVETPYKVFTLDEIKTLQGMDLPDNVIAAMIDITTQLLRDEKLKKQQTELIAKQEGLSNQQTKVIVREKVVEKESNSNTVENKIIETVGKKIGEKLFDKLF